MMLYCIFAKTGATSNLSGLTEMNEEAAFSHTLRNVGLNTALKLVSTSYSFFLSVFLSPPSISPPLIIYPLVFPSMLINRLLMKA